jgi:hypothetical protein
MSRIVGFHFRSYDEKNAAKDKIYYDCGGSAAYEDYGSERYDYEDGYTLYITTGCTDVERARQICLGFGGRAMVK